MRPQFGTSCPYRFHDLQQSTISEGNLRNSPQVKTYKHTVSSASTDEHTSLATKMTLFNPPQVCMHQLVLILLLEHTASRNLQMYCMSSITYNLLLLYYHYTSIICLITLGETTNIVTQTTCIDVYSQTTTSPSVVLPYTSIQSDLFTTPPLVMLPYTSTQSDLFTTSPLVPHFHCQYTYVCNRPVCVVTNTITVCVDMYICVHKTC